MAPTVLAECRPNLRSCYFFMKNIPNSGNATVDVNEQRISVRIPDGQLCIILPPVLKLVPGNISGEIFTNCAVTFRTRINSFGLNFGLDENSNKFAPNLQDEAVSLKCDFCHESLTEARVFSRVLPLPSSDEPNDFFCHRHSDQPVSLDPKLADFFYNDFFYKIHVDNFRIPPPNGHLSCPKCLELLGEVRGKCAKLWNFVVSSSTDEGNEEGPIEKFMKSFLRFIKNLPVQMNKFVLTSRHGSSMHYTLMWIVDRALVILENPEGSGCGSSIESNIHLEHKTVMKVLYSYHEQLTETVEEWMKSFNTSIIPIPTRIEEKLVDHLKCAADKIPVEYAIVNEMSVSYIGSSGRFAT